MNPEPTPPAEQPPSPKSEQEPSGNLPPSSSPSLRTRLIRTLRSTSRALEQTAQKLEQAPPNAPLLPVQETLDTAKRTVEKTQSTLQQIPEKVRPVVNQVGPLWQKIRNWWAETLPVIRSVLPSAVRDRFSDRTLTGAIAGLLVVLLWVVPGLFSGSKPQNISQTPREIVPPQLVPSPTPVPRPAQPIPSPTPAASPSPIPSPVEIAIPIPTPSPESPPTDSRPPEPPAKPARKTRPPKLNLTPEQKLITAIQEQVADLSNQYSNGLIQSIQANFRSGRLTVKVGEGWYELESTRQDRLAAEMLQRTQKLDFSRLEIIDDKGAIVARSPVVGKGMVILQRGSLDF